VVFPKPAQRGGVAGETRVERERAVLRVHRQRTGTGGVNADAGDLLRREKRLGSGGAGEGFAHGGFERGEVIGGVLAREQVVGGVENDALFAGRVVEDGAGEFAAVGAVHDECAGGVRAVVETDGVGGVRGKDKGGAGGAGAGCGGAC